MEQVEFCYVFAQEMLEYEKQKTQEALEQMRNNEDQKEAMRQRFIAELMRRQEVSGTFEDATGAYVMMCDEKCHIQHYLHNVQASFVTIYS